MVTLVYMDADGIERSFMLGPEPVVIGRSPECGIRSNDPLVSRNHARMYLDQVGSVCIEDLGSANGVYVGQHKVSAAAVPVGEIILVGSLRFRQMPANVPPAQPEYPAGQAYGAPPQPEYAAGQAYGAPPQPEYAAAQAYGAPAESVAPQAYGAPPAEYAAPQPYGAPPAAAPSPYAMPPQAMQQPPAMPPQQPPAMPPPAAVAPQAASDGHGAIAHLLEVERQGRLSAEQERDAYGSRMSELHKELRTLKDAYALLQQQESTSRANIEQLKKKPVLDPATAEGRAAALAEELEHARDKVDDSDDRVKSAEARLASAEEELAVARADLLASEERLMSEMSAMERRTSAELSMRVDELNVARADLSAAEDRILNLSRTISELEQRLARHGITQD